MEGVDIIGPPPGEERAGLATFTMTGAHPHDIATIVDQNGVAIRAGHHCAQPLMDHYDIGSAVRASFAIYNTRDEIDVLVQSLDKVKAIFG